MYGWNPRSVRQRQSAPLDELEEALSQYDVGHAAPGTDEYARLLEERRRRAKQAQYTQAMGANTGASGYPYGGALLPMYGQPMPGFAPLVQQLYGPQRR